MVFLMWWDTRREYEVDRSIDRQNRRPSVCKWKWNDRYEVWQTTCGSELSYEENDYLDSELTATHCIWCGGEIERDDSEMGRAQREEERALRRDYYEAVRPRW